MGKVVENGDESFTGEIDVVLGLQIIPVIRAGYALLIEMGLWWGRRTHRRPRIASRLDPQCRRSHS
jgi:hypothetical protein